MSDHKPITGELRGAWIGQDVDTWMFDKELFDRLCDSIDAIHAGLERENAELKAKLDRRSCIYYDPKRNYCSWHDIDTDDLVELPKDADKAHICVGDKLDGYGKTIEVVELRYGRSGWVIISRDGNAYADTFAFTHHHPDTWERIIDDAELLAREWFNTDMSENEHAEGLNALVARCKKLAGEAE